MKFNEAPSYVQAADAHNIASDGDSIFEDVTTALGNAPSFLAVSIASGLNSFYNTGTAVGNIFSDESNQSEMRDTADFISTYDDDLGKYYEGVREEADLVGFIGTSFVPGLGGIKALRAGQTALRAAAAGEVGANMRLATNLLAPTMETYVKREGAELAAKSATFSFAHANSVKALAAGTGQQVLESLAFEIGVAATMFKSPILEDMDTEDLIKNMAFGTLLGGGIGAIGSAATTYTGVKRLLVNADSRQLKVTGSTRLTSSEAPTNTSDMLVVAAADREALLTPVTDAEVLALKVKQGETGESLLPTVVEAEVAKTNRLREANIKRLDNEIRTYQRKLAREDMLGNSFADLTAKLDARKAHATFFNVKNISRVADETTVEARAKQLIKDGQAKNMKQALKQITDEVDVKVRLHSGQVGEQISGTVGVPRLADVYDPVRIEKLLERSGHSVKQAIDFRAVKTAKDVELRWMAARRYKTPFLPNTVIGAHDLPFLDKAVRDGMEKVTLLRNGRKEELVGRDNIKKYLTQAKEEVITSQKQLKHNTNFIELASDVRRDFLEGTSKLKNVEDNFFAQDSYAKELSEFLERPVTADELHLKPRYGKVTYDTSKVTDEDGHVLQGMQQIKYREKLARQATDKVFAKFAGEFESLFLPIDEKYLRSANRTGSGAGFVTNAGGNYGTLESLTSAIGNGTSEMTRAMEAALKEELQPFAVALAREPEAALRWSLINETVSATPERYVLDEFGEALIPEKIRDYRVAVAKGESVNPPELFAGTKESIDLPEGAVRDAVTAHIAMTGKRNETWKELHAVQGNEDRKALDVFRPIRPNPKDYRYVAFVKDETLVGVGHTRMLFANTSADLDAQIAKVPPQYKVHTKGESEDFYTARGEWEYDKTLHENYLDQDLKARGVSSRLLPQTDPQKIINDWVGDHVAKENTLIKQMVLAKYEKEVTELRRLGDQFSNTSRSKTGQDSLLEMVTTVEKNPYYAQVKAMLNITKIEEAPQWNTLNQTLDKIVSTAWDKAAKIRGEGAVTTAQIDEIHKVFDEVGFKSAYYDAATTLLANSSVPRGVLTGFVRKANAFLTTTVLRLDAFNSVNNLLGNTILLSSELKSLTSAIKKGSAEGAGELAALQKINIPGVDGQLINSPAKLIANSIKRLHGEGKEALIAEYKARGLAPDLADQYYKSLDAMTIHGTEGIAEFESKSAAIGKAWEAFGAKGEKLTGNKWVEQFNRMIAADVMRQVTDIAVKHGVIDEKVAWAYVNTFSNRVNGVIRAAERPLMFQGPVGQAMGLFQSYQFNLMQQLFRNIGEGRGKIAAMAMGLQGSIYGASSLPGFNLINSSLIGQAAGNEGHKDIYSATNLLFGKTGAEWIMYGAPSNVLRAALFTRGDTNPRTWSIVPNPTNPGDLPFISAFGKVFKSTYDSVSAVGGGAPVWDSFLSGIEHMGLNRPLAGLAQTARAFTNPDGKVLATQANGTILGSNDLVSWATLTRLVGSKPIDDAITSNAYFRVQGYAAADRAKRERLGTALKLKLQGGGTLEGEEVAEFAQAYVEKGGKQTGFNQWMMEQYKNTDRSRAEALAQKLNSPYALYMQDLMGGKNSLSEID